MSKGSDNPFPSVLLVEGSAPAAPASGDQRLYIDSSDHIVKKINSGGTVSPVAGIVQLAQQTLGASAASVTFSSISGAYSTLMLVAVARSDAAASNGDILIQFNGDTGSNYDDEYMGGNGSSVNANERLAQTAGRIGVCNAANAPTGQPGQSVTHIAGYAGTTFRKTWTTQTHFHNADSTGNIFTATEAGTWRSTSAITSIKLVPSSGNFIAGCAFSLYGIM